MSTSGAIFLILALLASLCLRLRQDYIKGLCYAVALLVCLPTYLRIEMPNGLPALTIHRLILIVLIAIWVSHPEHRQNRQGIPLLGLFAFWAGANSLSLIFTHVEFTSSLKSYLDFVFETFLFYLVVSTSVRNPQDGLRILRAVGVGITIVALLAVIEKYTKFNPVTEYLRVDTEEEGTPRGGVISTFPHRILLGTGMAMGWPVVLALVLRGGAESVWHRRCLWISIAALLSACYFSTSRGPWLATALAGLVLVFLGSPNIRKKILLVGVLAGFTLLVKPGVLETLSDMVKATADADSMKGGTFLYRLELWKIAWTEVSKSPVRLLLGYGQGAGRSMDLEWQFSYRDYERPIQSWDNQFAYDLFQSGVLGLLASLLLYGNALSVTYGIWKKAILPDRDVLACLLASTLALVFMRTNVLIFAKQLNFMFWSLMTVGIALGRPSTHPEDSFAPTDHRQTDRDPATDECEVAEEVPPLSP